MDNKIDFDAIRAIYESLPALENFNLYMSPVDCKRLFVAIKEMNDKDFPAICFNGFQVIEDPEITPGTIYKLTAEDYKYFCIIRKHPLINVDELDSAKLSYLINVLKRQPENDKIFDEPEKTDFPTWSRNFNPPNRKN